MGLKEQKTVNAIQRQNKPQQGKKPPADSAHSCGCCTKFHPPGRSYAQQGMTAAKDVEN